MDTFKEAIIQQLDDSGVLDSVRAQLRSLVYMAIEAKNVRGNVKSERTDAGRVAETEEGLMAACLFKDFLESFKAVYTLGVFLPECKVPENLQEDLLLKKMELIKEPGIPLLFSLIRKSLGSSGLVQKHSSMPFRGEPVITEHAETVQKPVQGAKPSFASLDLAQPIAKSTVAALDLAQASRSTTTEDSTVLEKKRLSEIEARTNLEAHFSDRTERPEREIG